MAMNNFGVEGDVYRVFGASAKDPPWNIME
jgi:hypothetical protein